MFERIVLNTGKKTYVYKIPSKRSVVEETVVEETVVEETVVEGVVLAVEDTAVGGIDGVV